jgi:hypothetical protein
MSRRLAIALVHHPVLDKEGAVVTSTLTNLDVHDLARSARTYDCSDYFIVHPVASQRELAKKIVDHWTTGSSAKRIPDRKDALAIVRTVGTLADATSELGPETETWITSARPIGTTLGWTAARQRLAEPGPPVLLVFGTAWGLAPEIAATATVVLAPIEGQGGYNHLSVRSACAISLDRLRGDRGDG